MRAIPHARATFIKAGDESSTEEEKDDDGDAPKKKKRVRGWMLMPWIVRHRSGIFFYSVVFFFIYYHFFRVLFLRVCLKAANCIISPQKTNELSPIDVETCAVAQLAAPVEKVGATNR